MKSLQRARNSVIFYWLSITLMHWLCWAGLHHPSIRQQITNGTVIFQHGSGHYEHHLRVPRCINSDFRCCSWQLESSASVGLFVLLHFVNSMLTNYATKITYIHVRTEYTIKTESYRARGRLLRAWYVLLSSNWTSTSNALSSSFFSSFNSVEPRQSFTTQWWLAHSRSVP